MPNLIRPPDKKDSTTFLRMLFLRTERQLIDEINRKRQNGYVDYAEVAALKRVQQILRDMVDECWMYVPKMIETIFYRSEAAANGYRNAAGLTATQLDIVEQLSNNLLGDIAEAAEHAEKHIETVFQIGRLEEGKLREEALKAVARQQATGYGTAKAAKELGRALQEQDVTVFIDKAGRKWSLQDYCNMVTRTTARQAEISAILTADPNHDLYQIVKIGSTCPVCASLEGRVYSRSGNSPDYPALAKAFGKIDPAGGDDLSNTYLNIHPNCLHALIKYTTIGKTDKQIQKDKDFSSFEKNPVTVDPRTKRQIAEYREKVRNRQRLLADKKQHAEYRRILGDDVPKDFDKFREMKYNDSEKWNYTKGLKEYLGKYPTSSKKFYDAGEELKALGIKKGLLLPPVQKQAFVLPEGKHDPYHIMHRMLERNMTDDDVRSYMTKAKVMFVQWGGKRHAYYGNSGIAVITKTNEDWIYKTAWKRADFDEETEQILEVIKKHGI